LDLVNERQVRRETAVNLSREWGGVPYYETSSRREINVRLPRSLFPPSLSLSLSLVDEVVLIERLGKDGID